MQAGCLPVLYHHRGPVLQPAMLLGCPHPSAAFLGAVVAHGEGTGHGIPDQLRLRGTAIYMCSLAACPKQARQMATGLEMHPGGVGMNGASCLFVLIHFGSAVKHAAVAASSTREGILQPRCPRRGAPGSPAQQSSNQERISAL